jgi:hypothetical protein
MIMSRARRAQRRLGRATVAVAAAYVPIGSGDSAQAGYALAGAQEAMSSWLSAHCARARSGVWRCRALR